MTPSTLSSSSFSWLVRLKIETEAWTGAGVATSVGNSYVLEPGQPVQTTLYDGKLYTLTITGQQELETTVRIVKVMGGESHQREDQLRCLESLGQLKLRA